MCERWIDTAHGVAWTLEYSIYGVLDLYLSMQEIVKFITLKVLRVVVECDCHAITSTWLTVECCVA